MRDGILVVLCYKGATASNVDQTGDGIEASCELKTEAGVALALARNVAEYWPKIEASCKAMADATGVSGVAVEQPNWNEFQAMINRVSGSGYENRAAECLNWLVTDGLKTHIAKAAKDDLVKEAIADAWKGPIRFVQKDDLSGYYKTSFENGTLVVTFKRLSNVSDCGNDIEKNF